MYFLLWVAVKKIKNKDPGLKHRLRNQHGHSSLDANFAFHTEKVGDFSLFL